LQKRNRFCYFVIYKLETGSYAIKQSFEELYQIIMKDSSFHHDVQEQEPDANRFKSILFPDYSDYTTSTVTGNIN